MLKMPSLPDAFEVLCLQAADEGRGEVLFGESFARARTMARPFMIGEQFPSVYLEFPLVGDPFLDVTMLYNKLEPGMRVESDAASGTEPMIDWFADACSDDDNVCCGFELDTKDPALPRAAVHFQPRARTELVEPFCEAIGEPERARLFLSLAERMPQGWPLSFFGLFRGRPDAPLRVCGYLGPDEQSRCVEDPGHLAVAFDQVGFSAYDEAMLGRVAELMAVSPGTVDFQFDVYDDGRIGSTFGLDVQFGIERPESVRATFEDGVGSSVMKLLESWGAADERWKLCADAAFARAVNVGLEDGGSGRFAFTLMPQWVKARWHDCTQQPSKLYHFAHAGLLL